MQYTYEELAGMIDHALLAPTLTDGELAQGCQMAARYRIATVCVKPAGVATAAGLLRGTPVGVGTVIGFPHGGQATAVKVFETQTACAEGATEVDMVINLGQAIGGNWAYVEHEIRAVADTAHARGAKLKVIFETALLAGGGGGLSGDDLKRRLCEISERAGADWVKTSTGYGQVKEPDGRFTCPGATAADLRLMRAACSPRVQVKASGGIRDLAGVVMARGLGCTRVGTSATAAILDEFRRQAAGTSDPASPATGAVGLGAAGY